MKDKPDTALVRALEKTVALEHLGDVTQTVRRLVCLVRLPVEEWSSTDLRWGGELDAAEKGLLGVWSSRVLPEAVLVHVVFFNKSEDYRKLYWQSVGELGLESQIVDGARKLLGSAF
jgi:hypothetical protein